MSRIGLKPIEIPAGVEIKFNDGLVEVKGPKGNLTQEVGRGFELEFEENQVTVKRPSESKQHRSLHGLYRTLIANMIIGVTEGYKKQLEIIGTGYRAQKQGNKLNLSLGFSHPVILEDPEGITTEVPNERVIIVSGIDKQLVGNYTAKIRAFRSPEPYKGKGIKYSDEYIRRKVGKTGK
ncbi:50S ribosomal protein L6 [Helcococcus ovis]|uniref:Large ribosomal subunit protein uL6 n=1 Tax=Helcococcus ovis TaxID=72026 RepID=A0A4R9C4Z4_9FIRM|nr:50S ribosomal protein L6 [Helcococcus ovis]TFF66229.1 50S ribosomal protein L6 [Helcococcus ovis]TFF66348.1 50S ribosomal protein L6 [Helcococcus ovis]TFF67292.1 50S ribosomal protein L6 [Helcococcus ovis]WNZ00944.1 50S ribosomal protein L6 [Helcococcus ovis]